MTTPTFYLEATDVQHQWINTWPSILHGHRFYDNRTIQIHPSRPIRTVGHHLIYTVVQGAAETILILQSIMFNTLNHNYINVQYICSNQNSIVSKLNF